MSHSKAEAHVQLWPGPWDSWGQSPVEGGSDVPAGGWGGERRGALRRFPCPCLLRSCLVNPTVALASGQHLLDPCASPVLARAFLASQSLGRT